ncbi:MAG: hypothetical protein HY924_14925 [Elusimicrobia bacterium]|nr:hypothetical protein [Elusimicrobiota bacterium]
MARARRSVLLRLLLLGTVLVGTGALGLALLGTGQAGAEAGIGVQRRTAYLSPSGVFRFRPKTTQRAASRNPEWPGAWVVLNRWGFRGPEGGPGGPKVLLLGDSYVFGNGLKDAETLDRRLEPLLRRRAPTASVLNLGVPGYNLESSLILAREMVDRHRPAAAVVTFLEEDDLAAFDISARLSFDLAHPRWSALLERAGLDPYLLERRFLSRRLGRERLEDVLRRRVLEPGLQRRTRLIFYLRGRKFLAVFSALGLEAVADSEPRPCEPLCFIPGDGHPTAELVILWAEKLAALLGPGLSGSGPR